MKLAPTDTPSLRFRLAVGLIRRLAPGAYEDIVRTADVVRASELDWTLVRVSLLSDGPMTGRVNVGRVSRGIGMRLRRADLARFLLEQVQDTRYVRQAPLICN